MDKLKNWGSQDRFLRDWLRHRPSDESPSLSEHFISSSHQSSPSSSDHSSAFTANEDSVGRKGCRISSFACRIREHVRLGPKLSETMKGKLRVGAEIIKKGGRENIFRDIFGVSGGEQLLKASQCYLSTTGGRIAGILFVSTEKVAFSSERSINIRPSSGSPDETPHKLSILLKKITAANEIENVDNPAQNYIQIVTDDNSAFSFMGFVRYEKALINLQTAISLYR